MPSKLSILYNKNSILTNSESFFLNIILGTYSSRYGTFLWTMWSEWISVKHNKFNKKIIFKTVQLDTTILTDTFQVPPRPTHE